MGPSAVTQCAATRALAAGAQCAAADYITAQPLQHSLCSRLYILGCGGSANGPLLSLHIAPGCHRYRASIVPDCHCGVTLFRSQICRQFALSRCLPAGRVMGIALAKRTARTWGGPPALSWGTTSIDFPFMDNDAAMDRWNFPRRTTPVAMPELGDHVRCVLPSVPPAVCCPPNTAVALNTLCCPTQACQSVSQSLCFVCAFCARTHDWYVL